MENRSKYRHNRLTFNTMKNRVSPLGIPSVDLSRLPLLSLDQMFQFRVILDALDFIGNNLLDLVLDTVIV